MTNHANPGGSLSESPAKLNQVKGVFPEQLEIGDERIGTWCLMRAVNRIQEQMLDIGHQWGEEGEDDIWTANREYGSPNDREWDTVATAPTFVALLTKLGDSQ